MDNWTTRRDAIEQDLLPALGEHHAEYDIDAIAHAVYQYDEANRHFVSVVSFDEFWAVVAQHPLHEEEG